MKLFQKLLACQKKSSPYTGWAFLGLLTDKGWGQTGPPFSKTYHTYPAMIELGKVIPYPKRI